MRRSDLASFPGRTLSFILLVGFILACPFGCTTIAWETTDFVSAKAAEEESPAQEAQEGPIEGGVEEAGKATQAGIQKVEAVKKAAIEKAKSAVD